MAGILESDRAPLPPQGVWQPADGGPRRAVTDWRQLRCCRCGGGLYAESIEPVIHHDEQGDDAGELHRAAPRRGRPPKWLVEQRRRQSDAAESRL